MVAGGAVQQHRLLFHPPKAAKDSVIRRTGVFIDAPGFFRCGKVPGRNSFRGLLQESGGMSYKKSRQPDRLPGSLFCVRRTALKQIRRFIQLVEIRQKRVKGFAGPVILRREAFDADISLIEGGVILETGHMRGVFVADAGLDQVIGAAEPLAGDIIPKCKACSALDHAVKL